MKAAPSVFLSWAKANVPLQAVQLAYRESKIVKEEAQVEVEDEDERRMQKEGFLSGKDAFS